MSEAKTLKQLYQIVMPDSEGGPPTTQIFINTKELPACLEQKFKLNDTVNLIEITKEIIAAYRGELFKKKIERIENSPGSSKLFSVGFNAPLEKLTDEETQTLAEALQIKDNKVSHLMLPLCNFNYLITAIATHPALEQIDLSKLDVSAEVSTGLSQIVAENSKIQRIKCDYQFFLQAEFQQVIKSIKNNDQSQLKIENRLFEYKYIELVDSRGKNPLTAADLLCLINAIQNSPEDLSDIRIVINLSMLGSGLEQHLDNKKLLPFSDVSGLYIEYLPEDEKRRNAPLLHVPKETKFILSPCYSTHVEVMKEIRSYLEKKISSEQSDLRKTENFYEITEAELEEFDDAINSNHNASCDRDSDKPNPQHSTAISTENPLKTVEQKTDESVFTPVTSTTQPKSPEQPIKVAALFLGVVLSAAIGAGIGFVIEDP